MLTNENILNDAKRYSCKLIVVIRDKCNAPIVKTQSVIRSVKLEDALAEEKTFIIICYYSYYDGCLFECIKKLISPYLFNSFDNPLVTHSARSPNNEDFFIFSHYIDALPDAEYY